MKDTYSYIEFKFDSLTKLQQLQTIFCQLKKVKDSCNRELELTGKQPNLTYQDPVEDYQWKKYLNQSAITWFKNTFDFNSEEGIIYWKLWELTESEVRLHHPFFKTPGNWHFESMLDAIFNGYFKLIDLVKEKDHQGCLYYQPIAYPFAGTDSLRELIKSFGNQIIYDSRHKYNKSVVKSAWDYELAQKLVKQGIGFTPEILEML